MLTFFYSTGTCSTAVHIALMEAGLPFEGVEVSWQRKVKLEELATVNPLGQVPVLVVDGRPLNQSVGILQYIAGRSPHLFPAPGSWEFTQGHSWLAFIAADLQKSFGPLLEAARWTGNEEAQNDIRKATYAKIDKLLGYVNQSLAGKDFLLGSQFTVADAYLFVVAGWCKWAQIKIGKFPHLKSYMKRVHERPAVQKVLAAEGLDGYLPE